MKRPLYFAIAVGHVLFVLAYLLLSGDEIGAILLLVFGIAMALMGWMLIPTFGDVGPTAPVDPDWDEHRG
jgi:hypothetical protein